MDFEDLKNDPLVLRADELIEEVVGPWKGRLPPEVLDAIRFQFEVDLLVDPNGRAALRRTLEDKLVEISGEQKGSGEKKETKKTEGSESA